MSSAHSKYSASKFKTLMLCAGKLRMEEGLPDSTSKYAAEGTAAHKVLEAALLGENWRGMEGCVYKIEKHDITVDSDMITHVATVFTNLEELTAGCLLRQAESRVNYAVWLGVPEHEGWGTADCIAVMPNGVLQIHDLKYGKGVSVDAEQNVQMMLYALGAYEAYKEFIDIHTVEMYIHQPRVIAEPQLASMPLAEVVAWVESEAQMAVTRIEAVQHMPKEMIEDFLVAGEEQCRFCKAAVAKRSDGVGSICSAYRSNVIRNVYAGAMAATPEEFTTLQDDQTSLLDGMRANDSAWFSSIAPALSFIRNWCDAVQLEMDRRVLSGEHIKGLKAVMGRAGNRAWGDKKLVEDVVGIRGLGDVMYERSLLSPAQAEKLVKAKKVTDYDWSALSAYITQSSAQPTVVPESDKRPAIAISATADEFGVVED